MSRRIRIGVGPVDGRSPRYGIDQLDTVLDGMWWGDNVLWVVDDGLSSVDVVLAGVIALADGRDVSDRGFSRGAFDLRDHASIGAVADTACTVVREGKTALWICPRSSVPLALRELAQVIVDQNSTHLRVERADGRRSQVVGTEMPYAVDDGIATVGPPSTVSRLGAGLRSIRKQRGWSQADVGAMIGVSGSAISQTERGTQSLSLDTAVELAERLGVSIDHLVHGADRSYELSRPASFGRGQSRLAPSSPQHFRIVAFATMSLSSSSTGSVSICIGSGVVKLELADDSIVLGPGDVVRTTGSELRACRNLSAHPALIFQVNEHS
ncbi:helix-turn-helix domain-containing protein [Rhodococcoides fascians]|uniref:helix-turn-helix domain-containing protein n=1 Tax=Rhodococcoides fascians TaxID=1828 RepID=UPI000B31D214|nr:helix-turn-helix transcriptional regulator [Rhodococcus fascians]